VRACRMLFRRRAETNFFAELRHANTKELTRKVRDRGTRSPARETRALPFVQGDAGAHPGLVDVEIDAHHFALTHSD